MNMSILVIIAGLILLYFLDAAFKLNPFNLEMLIHSGLRFFTGFVIFGVSVFYAHKISLKFAVCLVLALILAEDWKKTPQAGFAATLIARMSGDRARDIDENMRLQIIEKLKLSKAPVSWIEMVEQLKELDEKEEKQIFGEALPPGLKLINQD